METCIYCGRQFETYNSLIAHHTHCKAYKEMHGPYNWKLDRSLSTYNHSNKEYSINDYKLEDGTYQCECGKIFDKWQSLAAHFRHCTEHRKAVGLPEDKHETPKGQMSGWYKFSDEDKKQIHEKATITYHQNCINGITIPHYTGQKLSEEHKQHIREGFVKAIKERIPGFQAMYSKKGCEYINELNKRYDWHLQHAENGGEWNIDGYFLDGYDISQNIAFEYDEPKHYKDVDNNVLSDKDIERQNYIIKHLQCEFYRYNEKLDYFYKVN